MNRYYSLALKFLQTTDAKKLFVESDAWGLFKYSAFSEVVGWTLLIYGIVAPYYYLPGYTFTLAIGGSIHGMLYIAYVGILAATYSSLGWTRGKALVGFIVSALPYGIFFFEQWAAHTRRAELFGSYRQVIVRGIVRKSKSILVFQSGNSTLWQLPGGYIQQDESPEDGLVRIIKELTGIVIIAPKRNAVYLDESNKQIEFLFDVSNPRFKKMDLKRVSDMNGDIDEARFMDLNQIADMESSLVYLRSVTASGQ